METPPDSKPPARPESEPRNETGNPGSGQVATGQEPAAAGQPGGGQAAAKPERKRYGENLRHLMRQEMEEEVEVSDTLSNKMGAMFDKLRTRSVEETERTEQTAKRNVLLQEAGRVLQQITRHKKITTWVVVGVIGLFAVFYVAPLIPLQVERSAGFAAFEEGRYQEAQRSLISYLSKRPNDHQAMYYAAQAALYNGDLRYARDAVSSLYDSGAAQTVADLPYYYALVNLDRPKEALRALEQWLVSTPETLVGRLLRGVLLIGRADAKRKMREDFLYVDDLIQRESDPGERSKILFLHRYFQKSGKFSAILSPPLNPQADSEDSSLAVFLRFDPGTDGFIAKYNLSGGAPFLEDELSPAAVVNLYFAYGLMAGGDSQEAEVELKELQQELPNSPSLRQALAFLALYRGKQIPAAKIFSDLSQQVGNDPQTLNNLAVARWSAGGEEVAEIISIYDKILAQGGGDRIAINNGAFLEILSGDHAAAATRLGNVENKENFQHTLNLGLVELWQNRPKRAIGLFSSISETEFPRINYYLAAALEKNGDNKGAIATYRRVEDFPPDSSVAFVRRIRLMFRQGDWRLAYNDLTPFLRENEENAEAWYYRSLLALQLGERDALNEAKAMLANLSEDWHYLNALRGAEYRRDGEDRRAATAFRTAMEEAPNKWAETDYAAAWGEMEVAESPQEVADILLPMLEANFNPELAAVLSRAVAESRQNLAREIAESALATPPSMMTAKNTGLAFAHVGDAKRAVELLQSAYQWTPTDSVLLKALVDAQTAAEDVKGVQQSETTLAHLLSVERGEPPLYNIEYKVFIPSVRKIIKKVQGYIDGDIEDVEEVIDEYQNQLDLEESKTEPALLLYSQATFYMYLDRLPEALGSFRAALEETFSNPKQRVEAMLFYAEAQAQAKRYEEALGTLSHLIDSEGNTPLYTRLYAANLADLGREDATIQYLEDAIKRYPDDGRLYLELARAYYNQGELEPALQVAERMIRVAPNFPSAYDVLSDIYAAMQQPAEATAYARVKTLLNN